jgi:hypothetical protein
MVPTPAPRTARFPARYPARPTSLAQSSAGRAALPPRSAVPQVPSVRWMCISSACLIVWAQLRAILQTATRIGIGITPTVLGARKRVLGLMPGRRLTLRRLPFSVANARTLKGRLCSAFQPRTEHGSLFLRGTVSSPPVNPIHEGRSPLMAHAVRATRYRTEERGPSLKRRGQYGRHNVRRNLDSLVSARHYSRRGRGSPAAS